LPQLINPYLYPYYVNPALVPQPGLQQPVAGASQEQVPPTYTPEPTLTPVPSPTPVPVAGVPSGGAFIVDPNQVTAPGQPGNPNAIDLFEPSPTPTETETATPTPTPTPTWTPTPTATWGPPIIIFGAADRELREGECTKVSWSVENVVEVFYEGRGVNGQGEVEECIFNSSADFLLEVRLPSGEIRSRSVSVALILPTATPVPTWTFTPIPQPSPTWTPAFPTATPTPSVIHGVGLNVNGGLTHTCFIGETCEITLTTTNIGSHSDNLAIAFTRIGIWSPQLCRTDGVCGGDRLTINEVGPNNTASVVFRLTIPENTSRQTSLYAINVSSEKSGGLIRSGDTLIDIEAK